MNQSRQLAAIMFTDIVGYTSMMGSDENKAVSVIKHYNATLEKLVQQYHGQIINYYGDGSLCIFSSATDAVKCAMEVQQELQKEPVVPLRIGLHVGEVFFEDAKALGDGVNVASRIQSLGQASTILFSREIYDKIKNQPDFKSISLGKFDFKNVDEPMEAFALINEGLNVPKRAEMEGKLKTPSSDPNISTNKKWIAGIVSALLLFIAGYFVKGYFKGSTTKPKENSVAVLYFDNISQDQDQEYFSDGITEEIIAHIAKLNDIRVISRTSVLPYKGKTLNLKAIAKELNVTNVLEGSVRKSGNKIRVTAQLIDANTDQHIWAETYDREMKDIFDVQSEIARMIAQKLKIAISPEANAKIDQVPTKSIEAYEQFQKGYYYLYKKYFNTHDPADFEKSKHFFEKAIQLDSNYAEAYSGLAEVYDELRNFFSRQNKLDSFPPDLLILKEKLARKALSINPNSSFVNTAMAYAILHRTNPNFDSSLYFLKNAYHLAPRDPLTNNNLAFIYNSHLGLHEVALPFLQDAIKGDPLDPELYRQLGDSYTALGQTTEAKNAYQKSYELADGRFSGDGGLINGMIYHGDLVKAQSLLEKRPPNQYTFARARLYAAKGEISKIDTAFIKNDIILLTINKNKKIEGLTSRIDKAFDQHKIEKGFGYFYNVLKNNMLLHSYREDPDYKKLLIKAKGVHDEYLAKYGMTKLKN